jgi:hypothetical protein
MIDPPPRSLISENADDYRQVFLGRVHELLQRGYERLTPAALTNEEEQIITGELVRGMTEILDEPNSEDWVQLFSVHDDPPVNKQGRKGKRRRRVDIRVDSAEKRPRSRLAFEAKRLGPKHSTGYYLGSEGLGCFLAGEYGADDSDGGMVGYFQCDTADIWAKRLEEATSGAASELWLAAHGAWATHHFPSGPKDCFKTSHARPSLGRAINLYHTLLRCC